MNNEKAPSTPTASSMFRGAASLLHENIAHDEIEKLILETLNKRLHKGPPGRIYLRMFL
ncbi:MAG: hypothetical protein LBB68_07720 [Treponema sp.]|nr:hypothetical protein [Treponema sp.]